MFGRDWNSRIPQPKIKKMGYRIALGIAAATLGATFLAVAALHPADSKSVARSKESLGKALFIDTGLSEPPGQSCATCHDPASHFANPKHAMIAEGAVHGRFGNRKPPSIAYASFSPDFHFDRQKKDYVGGYFWDGRAKTLVDQAKGPFMNPAEMNNTSRKQVVEKVRNGPSAKLFEEVYGSEILRKPNEAFDKIADAIAAYERSVDFHPFTSKYDFYLQGQAKLTKQELHVLRVIESEDLGNCAACHPNKPSADGKPPLFTDFTYDNVGLPPNPRNPFLKQPKEINPDGAAFLDEGLARTTTRPQDLGRFKVPTLRNIAATGPFFHHSGVPSLKEAILFYSVRDSGRFGKAEISKTMNRKELGALYLTKTQARDLEAFLRTLTDGYRP